MATIHSEFRVVTRLHSIEIKGLLLQLVVHIPAIGNHCRPPVLPQSVGLHDPTKYQRCAFAGPSQHITTNVIENFVKVFQ